MATVATESETSVLQRRVEELHKKVAQLEQENARSMEAEAQKFVQLMDEISDLTSRIFETEVTLSIDYDPEYPQHKYFVLKVVVDAEIPRIIEMERQWIEETRPYRQKWPSFSLLILPAIHDSE